MKMVTNKMKTL